MRSTIYYIAYNISFFFPHMFHQQYKRIYNLPCKLCVICFAADADASEIELILTTRFILKIKILDNIS